MGGWLDDVLGGYLDSVTEREFDAAFLGILRAEGYSNVHFLHGAYEFGKDFIGRREGVQYGFQTKAGDIGLGSWRTIRSQVEEILWNDIAHPDFDEAAPRIAVLVTTGRLTGGASADAQQFRATLAKRMDGGVSSAQFEVWDRERLISMLELSPEASLNGWGEAALSELLGLLADASRRNLTSRGIERSTRRWISEDLGRVTLATALVGNRLLETRRPDLAMTATAGLLRAAALGLESEASEAASVALAAGRRLLEVYAGSLLEGLAAVKGDPRQLALAGGEVVAGVTYPVRCSLALQTLGLLGLLRLDEGDDAGAEALTGELEEFIATQPGASHPISDVWAASLIPAAVLLRRLESPALVPWLQRVAVWVCDHYADSPGLASVYGEPLDEVLYLAGGAFEHVDLAQRSSSYLATTLLDLASALELPALFSDALNDFLAVNIAFPTLEPLDEPGQFLFDGDGLRSEANVRFDEDHEFAQGWRSAVHHRRAASSYGLQRMGGAWEMLAIACALRDRHFLAVTRELAGFHD